MSELKTKRNNKDINKFLNTIYDNKKREDIDISLLKELISKYIEVMKK